MFNPLMLNSSYFLQLASTEYRNERLSRDRLLEIIDLCRNLLQEGSRCLNNERKNSIESYFEIMIKGFLDSIDFILLEF